MHEREIDKKNIIGPSRDVTIELVVPRDQIFYISWTFDAYEGVALLRTDDASAGRVSLLCSADYADDAMRIVDGLIAEGLDIDIRDKNLDTQ